jgi:hypothetical protein
MPATAITASPSVCIKTRHTHAGTAAKNTAPASPEGGALTVEQAKAGKLAYHGKPNRSKLCKPSLIRPLRASIKLTIAGAADGQLLTLVVTFHFIGIGR